MRQRSLVNSNLWVFIPPESVCDNRDYSAEQRLKQRMARGRPRKQVSEPTESQNGNEELARWLNKVAGKGTGKEPATAKSTGNRKRGETAGDVIEETSRKRRAARRQDNVNDPRSAREAIPAQLARPSVTIQHMTRIYPAVKQKSNDVYLDVSHPTEPLENTAVVQNPNGTSRQSGATVSAKRAKNTHLVTETDVPAEGHSSAVLNGRPNVTAKSGRGKSKTKTISKSTGIKANPSHRDVATLEGPDANGGQSDAGSEELVDDVDITECFHLETDDDDENDQQSLDLLEFEVDWKKILKAAYSVGGSKLPKNKISNVQTDTLKALITEVIEARTLYQNGSYDKPIDDLHETLIAIEERVKHDSISEAKAFNKKSEMIRDIYARAIPALVLLLESAISFHALHPKGLRRYEALQDIVRVQNIIVCLGMKAKMWRARPNTHKPIIKPTRLTIFPYTREMKKVFERELVKYRRKWKIQQNASKAARREESLVVYSQEQREVSTTTETNKGVARGLPHIQRERELFRGSRKPIGGAGPQFSQDNDVPCHSTRWNAEEEKELMRQLQFGYVTDQTAEMRYLAILNTRLLQNKLPERIREKALELKPFLKEVYGAHDWIESIL